MCKIWLLAVANHASEVAESYLQEAGIEFIRYPEEAPSDTEPKLELEDGRRYEGLSAIKDFCGSEAG